jgi:hypothetical protein
VRMDAGGLAVVTRPTARPKPAPDVAASLKARSAQSWAMPRNPYIRGKFTRRRLTALRDRS